MNGHRFGPGGRGKGLRGCLKCLQSSLRATAKRRRTGRVGEREVAICGKSGCKLSGLKNPGNYAIVLIGSDKVSDLVYVVHSHGCRDLDSSKFSEVVRRRTIAED
jgi:hypothetical protein